MFNPGQPIKAPRPQPTIAGDRMNMLRQRIDGQRPTQITPGAPRKAKAPTWVDEQVDRLRPGIGADGQPTGLYEDYQAPTDKAFEEFINEMMQGEARDTSEEEALIRELMSDASKKELVGNRARMGRSGFAESGASAAIEGDIMRQVGLSESGQIMDLRNEAAKEAVDNAFRAAGINLDMMTLEQQALYDAKIFEIWANDPDSVTPEITEDGPGVSFDPNLQGGADVNTTTVSPVQVGATTNKLSPDERRQTGERAEVGDGAVYMDGDGEYNYWSSDGTLAGVYKVRVDA